MNKILDMHVKEVMQHATIMNGTSNSETWILKGTLYYILLSHIYNYYTYSYVHYTRKLLAIVYIHSRTIY
jgi:hypothetical protein